MSLISNRNRYNMSMLPVIIPLLYNSLIWQNNLLCNAWNRAKFLPEVASVFD